MPRQTLHASLLLLTESFVSSLPRPLSNRCLGFGAWTVAEMARARRLPAQRVPWLGRTPTDRRGAGPVDAVEAVGPVDRQRDVAERGERVARAGTA